MGNISGFFFWVGVISFGIAFVFGIMEGSGKHDLGDSFEPGATLVFAVIGIIALIACGITREDGRYHRNLLPTAEAPLPK